MREELTREEILRRRREWRAKHPKKGVKKKKKKVVKKKPKKEARSRRNEYWINIMSNDRRKETVGKYKTQRDAYAKWNELIEHNKEVICPMRFINYGEIKPFHYDVMMFKRAQPGEALETKLRDEYGRMITYQMREGDEWLPYDKHIYEVEEKFWVYGYHPNLQRKTFAEIFEEFVAVDTDNKYDFKNICIFKNKFIVETSNKMNMVMCKNITDAIRVYNLTEEWCKKRKYKYVVFTGNMAESKTQFSNYVNKIHKLTGWNKTKILRKNLRP